MLAAVISLQLNYSVKQAKSQSMGNHSASLGHRGNRVNLSVIGHDANKSPATKCFILPDFSMRSNG